VRRNRRARSSGRRRSALGSSDLLRGNLPFGEGRKRTPVGHGQGKPVRFHKGKLTLAKMTEPLNIVWSRPLPDGARPSTVTVSQDSRGRWFVSLLCEDPTVKPLPATETAVGVDAGPDHLLTLSTGEKITNPRHERRDRVRLAKAQRAHSRKKKGSANQVKARLKIARIHARNADRRRDHTMSSGSTISASVSFPPV
jgi:transposase